MSCFLLSGCLYTNVLQEKHKPKNIVLMIGDGMGPAHIKALRMFNDDPNTIAEEELIFDQFLVGSLNTNSVDQQENITDSAASATAYATGKKTINGAVSVNTNQQKLLTVLETAKQRGMSTGLVVTSQLTHATPAAFFAHQIDREKEKNIANQLFDNQYQGEPLVDILLGGGELFLQRKDRNIMKEFQLKGYQLVQDKKTLLASDSEQVLGVFAKKGLNKMWDRQASEPSLAEMTQTAIKQLSKNPNGFFLVVEGSQIDWAAHDNDIVGVISEMQDFERAIRVVSNFTDQNSNTLMILTADHETGGLSLGSYQSGKDNYYWDVDVIRTFSHTPAKITTDAQLSGDLVAEFHKATSLKLTTPEINLLNQADLQNWEESRRLVAKIISNRSYTGWSSYGHTGVDVPLYAKGPGSELLRGYWENTRIGEYIFQLLKE